MQFILVLLVIFIFACTLSVTNFDMFRLGYTFTFKHWLRTSPISGNVLILYPLKTPGNQKASGVFRGYSGKLFSGGNSGQERLN